MGYTTETITASSPRLAAAALALLILAAGEGAAAVSSGGGYQVDSSARSSGGAWLYGGEYASRGAAAQSSMAGANGLAAAGAYVNRTGFYNPPKFTFQKGLPAAVEFNGANASVSLPAGAVEKEAFDITLNRDPYAAPLSMDAALLDSANLKIEHNAGAWSRLLPGNATELAVFDEMDFWEKPLLRSGTLSMRYRDDDGNGVLDGSSPPVRTETIRAWALDEELGMWAKLPGAATDAAARQVTAPLMAPGVYSLLGMLDDSVKDTFAFPVPFRPYGPGAGSGAGQTGTEADGITFMNVPQAGDIEIYTLDGRLVRKLPIPPGLVTPKLKWDVRTAGGERAASGVYIWRVRSGDNSKTGKLMLIW